MSRKRPEIRGISSDIKLAAERILKEQHEPIARATREAGRHGFGLSQIEEGLFELVDADDRKLKIFFIAGNDKGVWIMPNFTTTPAESGELEREVIGHPSLDTLLERLKGVRRALRRVGVMSEQQRGEFLKTLRFGERKIKK